MGQLEAAEGTLADVRTTDTDGILVLLERGTIRQVRGAYRPSALDFMKATELAEQLDYMSVTRQAASFVTSDAALAYRGLPYERTLLYAIDANNYFAMAQWDDAAVNGRNIIERQQDLNGFPDDAYSRYVAGLSLELAGDGDGASRQYLAAAQLAKHLRIDEYTGLIGPAASNAPPRAPKPPAELVCLIGLGHAATEETAESPFVSGAYAEILVDGKLLGRSHRLSDTGQLLAATQRRVAAAKVAKDVTRVVLKEVAAYQMSKENDALGMLLWIVLFAFEGQAPRHWETLPRQLHVARVPCPENLTHFTVQFKSASGVTLRQKTITAPLTRRYNTYVSFCRDVP